MFRIGLPCIVLSCAALFVTIVALTIPYWICLTPTGASAIYRSSELAYKNTYIGLWQFCYYLKTGPPSYNLSPTRSLQSTAFLCTPVGVIYGYFQATRALVILGMAMIATALVCGVIKQYMLQEHQALLKVGAGCGFAAGVFLLIGISVFSANVDKSATGAPASERGLEVSYHAGFGLCIVAAIKSVVTGAAFLVWNRKEHAGTANSVA